MRHRFKGVKITADRAPGLAWMLRTGGSMGRDWGAKPCGECGCSERHPIHFMPPSRGPGLRRALEAVEAYNASVSPPGVGRRPYRSSARG